MCKRSGRIPGTRWCLGLALLLGLLFPAAQASADQDPPSCTDPGTGGFISTFRADGATPVGAGTVTDGEVLKFSATLSFQGGTTCAYEGGTWTLTTPDGVVHPLPSPPRIGDPTTGTGAVSSY